VNEDNKQRDQRNFESLGDLQEEGKDQMRRENALHNRENEFLRRWQEFGEKSSEIGWGPFSMEELFVWLLHGGRRKRKEGGRKMRIIWGYWK
jgi:hypothetical protein